MYLVCLISCARILSGIKPDYAVTSTTSTTPGPTLTRAATTTADGATTAREANHDASRACRYVWCYVVLKNHSTNGG
ncbi:hypothetical protein BJV78DRAFT_1201536 [Lactifluus subvellereus]|nr:hypothetical protein BJV78DRAFT_1201536 [Lactifluus subvellereus]